MGSSRQRHSSNSVGKIEVWRVLISPCVDWDNDVSPAISGNGTYVGDGFILTVSGADAVLPKGRLLHGNIGAGGGGSTATYRVVFGKTTDVVWHNDTYASSIGGLSPTSGGNETVEITVGDFSLVDNSGDITPVGGASSYAPVITGLKAESNPSGDHAYYLGEASAETSFQWTHSNNTSKAEVWRLCLSEPHVPVADVPGLSGWWLLVLVLALGVLVMAIRVPMRPQRV